MKQTNHNCNFPPGTPIAWSATADMDPEPKVLYGGIIESGPLPNRIALTWPKCAPGGGATITLIAPGREVFHGRSVIPSGEGPIEAPPDPECFIGPPPGPNPFRKAPQTTNFTRAQVCGVNLTLQGLTCSTRQLGTKPWFEPAYQCLTDYRDRLSVRRYKRLSGDTHIILEFFTPSEPIYNSEDDQWCKHVTTPSFEQNPQQFRELVLEILEDRENSLVPIVAFDGDAGDDPQRGHPNALRQIPLLTDLFEGLHQNILYARLWDGVFYGSSPENIALFGRRFREHIPHGHLAIEHDPGHIPVGGGSGDWAEGGSMSTYDVLLHEFYQPEWEVNNDKIWQIGARVLGPRYRRPPDQDSTYDQENRPVEKRDLSPPWYLQAGNQRGPYFACAFEWVGLWAWVRGRTSAQACQTQRQYFRDCGWAFTG